MNNKSFRFLNHENSLKYYFGSFVSLGFLSFRPFYYVFVTLGLLSFVRPSVIRPFGPTPFFLVSSGGVVDKLNVLI